MAKLTPAYDDASKYVGRKFLLVLLFGFAGGLGMWTGRLTGGEFTTLALGLMTAFSASDAFLNMIYVRRGSKIKE